MDEKEKAKRFVSKSRRTKKQHGSFGNVTKTKSKRRKSKKSKGSSTTSTTGPIISPHEKIDEKEKEKEIEKKEQLVEQEKKKEPEKKYEHEKRKSDRSRFEWKEEREPESESDHDADLGMKKSHVVLPNRKGKPQKVAIKHRDVNEKDMEKLLKKLKENKSQPARPTITLDEKSKIFMDRVEKKPYPSKYAKKNKWSLLADDDDSEFFKPTTVVKKTCSETIVPIEDSYDYVPKLADVEKMPGENVYQTTMMMGEVPYWAVYLEPDENDSKDVEPPISVGSEHVEAFHGKQIKLKTVKSTKLVLDEFQPSCFLTKRDEKFFHPHLIFSNTVRSLINVQGQGIEKSMLLSKSQSKTTTADDEWEKEEQTQSDGNNVTIPKRLPISFTYERSRPILSAREEKERLETMANAPKTESKLSTTVVDVENPETTKT